MTFQAVGFLIVFFCIFTSSIHGATDPADASVLNGMYTTLNHPNQLTNWISNGGDPCGESWKGVKCAGSAVTEIDVSGLGLFGTVGFQLANLKSLINLDISHNSFGNQLPYGLPPNLQRLNIAGNGFTGGLPYSISQITSLKYINASHNQFQDPLNDMYTALSALSTLDFSFNVISGILPESFRLLSSLNTLNLNNNQFKGSIDVLADLPLTNLNVASNQFTGWIPERLKNIIEKDGNSFSSGPAPPPPPGAPPASPTPKPGKKSNPSADDSSKKSGVGAGVIAGIVISILVVGAIIAFFLVKRRSRKATSDEEKLNNQPLPPLVRNVVQEIKPVQTASAISTKTFETPAVINLRPPPNKSFDEDDVTTKPVFPKKKANTAPIDVKSYSIADLQMATGSFNIDNLIGEGSFGRVYRAQFDDGKVLAVKKIDSSILSDSEDFTEVVSKMSRLHHPNINKLVGYCSEHGQYLLVHEFHKIGSLHDFLHLPEEYSKPLIWNTRVKISLGTARALEYLHEVCSPSVVYKNFKSANILLGSTELNPQLTDCGLASFLPNADQALVHDGYSAPEVVMSGQYNLKSDVYSFGVVMLELLTGRKPFDSSRPRAEQSLVRWSTPQLHDIDALAKMVDPALKGLYPVKSLSRFADVIAICVQSEPEFRPPMSEVVQALVLLVERANMSKRTVGNDQGASQQTDNSDV